MKIVVAIGGNALLRRNQAASAGNQQHNIDRVADQLARLAYPLPWHQLVLTHGNGPQIGLLALQSGADATGNAAVHADPLDVLGAQTDGMLGYLLEQALANRLPRTRTVATLLTRVEVDPNDPAFQHPTKPIGPVYPPAEARRIAEARGWSMAPDGGGLRRVVASPRPFRVLGLEPIRWLLEHDAIVVAAGGGGIPVARAADGDRLHGVDAVIDKDLCSGLLAAELQADCLVIVTDVDAVYLDWGQAGQRAIGRIAPRTLAALAFPAGSMGPKVEAACQFVLATGKRAVIGSIDHIEAMLAGRAGTQVCADEAEVGAQAQRSIATENPAAPQASQSALGQALCYSTVSSGTHASP